MPKTLIKSKLRCKKHQPKIKQEKKLNQIYLQIYILSNKN